MNQQELREWERRCIQEEQPWCQASCPIHVDARAFMERMAAGDASGARKILERTMPLPGILGRICDHPCEAQCKRREAGDPLAIGALERTAMRLGRPGPKPLVLPAKNKKAAVVGQGLAAMTCAWDLRRKGYAVVIIAPGERLGGRLRGLPEELLPPAELDREIERLLAMGIEARLDQQDVAGLTAEALRGEFDAVFAEAPSPLCPARRGAVDPVTLAASSSDDGIFCGGWTDDATGEPSAMAEAADGRRAAASMDRFMSGASLTASREREGPFETRLFTSLKGVEPLARVAPADEAKGYEAGEAKAEAGRCLNCQCLECVKICAYLERYQGYPKKYARLIYNNAAIVQGVHQANKMVNSCSLCGLCTEVCPERFSMADLCRTARRDMVERGKMPPTAHEFALEDMAFSNGEDFALARAEPGQETCSHLFFPGCQLAASHPHHVRSVYAFLRGRLSGGVGLMLRCCGIPARWATQDELFADSLAELRAAWEKLGRPRVVAACSSCLAVFREQAPELQAVSLWQVLGETGLPEGGGTRPDAPLALHDPCTMRHVPGVREAVRAVLAKRDIPYEELELSGLYTECCGYGGLMGAVDPSMAHEVARRRTELSPRDFAASCAMCRDRLSAEGKRTWHVLDFLFPPSESGEEADPAWRGPGFSERHERRARLKAALLRDVWGETPPEVELEQGLRLEIPPEVQETLEERRILREDVAAAVARAERTGKKLVERASGRFLAYFRPRRVTYWVEYAREGDAVVVSRAWCHRMVVPGSMDDGAAEGNGTDGEKRANTTSTSMVYLPKSGDWACACGKSGEGRTMEPRTTEVTYLGSAFAISLLSCPSCGMVLVPEALAVGKMTEVEQLLEDK